ncbi:MAG: LytR/AlgR family response regulator transcription factor [Flavisolibacter sp.]|jgi:DNA-binding LytR/AlgR family response regulator
MNVLIVETQKREVRKLTRILRLIDPSITIVKIVNDMDSVLTWIQSNPSPDLVLVEHSELKSAGIQPQHIHAKLVLHTRQYHLTYLAFRAHTLHQLQHGKKLIRPSARAITINKAVETLPSTYLPVYPHVPTLFKNRFFVEHGQRFLSIAIEEIAYFFSDGRFVYFATFEKNKYLIQYRMDELGQLLNPEQFYRINRSYIISVKSIDQINPYFGGRFKLKLIPPVTEEILVSRNRATGFKIWLGE